MEQNFVTAEEARRLAEERVVILRKERKDSIMQAIVNNATRFGKWQVAVTTESYWDDDIYNFFVNLGYEVEIHPELIVIKWSETRSV